MTSDPSGANRDAALSSDGGPLGGIRVLDLSSYLAGPYGCTLLGDMGAEVIKVEAPAGDNFRNYPSTLKGKSRVFLGVNRNKRSIVLNLKQDAGLRAFYRLVARSDVVVENFRPRVAARLGVDYDSLCAVRPDIIGCSLTGYGESGPLSDKGGFDQVLQSMTGICTFQKDRVGMPQLVLGSIVDYYAAALVAQGVTAALFHRQRTGEGQHVAVSLLGSALAMQTGRFIWTEDEGRETDRDLQVGGVTGIHPTKDGLIYISAPTNAFWHALCSAVGLEEFGREERFATLQGRKAHTAEILHTLHAALQAHSAKEWEAIFGSSIPCAVVGTIEDMFDHPQVLAGDHVGRFQHPTIGRYRGFKNPIRFDRHRTAEPGPAPALGEHTEQVLRAFGCSEEDIVAVLTDNRVQQGRR
jgi:crotonobetainyl-CoA:carnitine CoA-transferase CaiB-like acyl-CoA transferase